MKLKITSLLFCGVLLGTTLNAQESSLEVPAVKWIKENARSLAIPEFSRFSLSSVRKGNTGETLRFQQMIKDVPVFQSEIIIHFNKDGNISYTAIESLKKDLKEVEIQPSFPVSEAIKKAHIASKTKGKITSEESKVFVYKTDEGNTKLVYRVLTSSQDHLGSWETMVDAKTGDIIKVQDIALYHHSKKDSANSKKKDRKKEIQVKRVPVSGSGYIFDPDPLSKVQTTYGGQYVDNDDATNASLDAARTLVVIPEIDFDGSLYTLKGRFAEIKEIELPATGLFKQSNNQFLFDRSQLGFEAVNAYWHIDKSMRYVNLTLGISCVPSKNGGVVAFDPHGHNGEDNSRYDYVSQDLAFGQGGVDDAEDADVILHELGHGLHDWMTGGNLSSVEGLSDGCGDYWAQSYSRSLNQWPSTAQEYNWVMNWDGHNPFWPGRITNTTKIYPGAGLSSYGKAQIFSSALVRIYDKIGREKTDRAFLEGLALTTSTTNQPTAATAMRQAAIDMLGQFGFNCNDITIMTQEFAAAGYVLPPYTCIALGTTEVAKENRYSVYPNPVSDVVNIILKLNKDEKVEIYNMEGRKVLETVVANGKNKINVSKLPPGNYILNIKAIDLSTKLIKK